ncbi:hypothetical protein J5N97_008732 [Dioscorea zingiberensis]|uniref:non-specific serine/threonine protein kinase n=1 Tax=Dioscorea zingiberensis TaxID=325984 RepID=A0A9D5HLN5_9LILI|nr:hypothetical protein J5N97_008732 [Dioscorea zingiberensis]
MSNSEMKALDVSLDSDGENGLDALNSSQSSTSSGSYDRCSSFSRQSIDTIAAAAFKPCDSQSSTKLGPQDFELVRRIGSGDIGTVYLCRLRNQPGSSSPPYAMKVVDNRELAKKKKLGRADAERRILRTLNHPFLPTLYADFDATPHYSCVVMEYCSGGDLHSLRHRLPSLRFPLSSARFYAAEVLLALEYLHMMGIVYRDLKPENVLIRSDGHIMLSDFDLSLQSTASPILEDFHHSSCLPFRCGKSTTGRFVAEPVTARSFSFVGTHEYVAPEVASGRAHGSAVDWWAFGVFLYELLYGRTPFVGSTNESTLRNIIHRPLVFPSSSSPSDSSARDLITGLLAKDPAHRLGSRRGAADVKNHPFFKGLNFALLRSYRAPAIPGLTRSKSCKETESQKPTRFNFF